MVDIGYGIGSDCEDNEEYCLEDENTIDNPVDNASSGNVVIVDPSPEQSVTPGVDVIIYYNILKWQWLPSSVFRLLWLNKKKKCYQSIWTRLSENGKINSQQETQSVPIGKKLVPAKRKKSPFRKTKLPQKFRATW